MKRFLIKYPAFFFGSLIVGDLIGQLMGWYITTHHL